MIPLLKTSDVAELLAVSEEWVRDHRAALGGIKLGSSQGAPLRFERSAIEDYIDRGRLEAPRARRRVSPPRGRADGVKLLTVPRWEDL